MNHLHKLQFPLWSSFSWWYWMPSVVHFPRWKHVSYSIGFKVVCSYSLDLELISSFSFLNWWVLVMSVGARKLEILSTLLGTYHRPSVYTAVPETLVMFLIFHFYSLSMMPATWIFWSVLLSQVSCSCWSLISRSSYIYITSSWFPNICNMNL